MTDIMSKQQYSLDYSQLIQDYKKDYFKKMPVLHHEFLYACCHPSLEDSIIALEKNYYPFESELFGLEQSKESFYQKVIKNLEGLKQPDRIKKFAEQIGIKQSILTEVSEEEYEMENNEPAPIVEQSPPRNKKPDEEVKVAEKQDFQTMTASLFAQGGAKVSKMHALALQLKDQLIQKIQIDNEEQEEPNFTKSMLSTFIARKHLSQTEKLVKKQTILISGELMKRQQLKPQKSNKEEEKDGMDYMTGENREQFRFQEPKNMNEQRLDSNNKKKYAVSIWNINHGTQSFQISEYAFNLKPLGKKFYVSHDSEQILLYLGYDYSNPFSEEESEVELAKILILSSTTLQVLKEINSFAGIDMNGQQIIDSALIWSCSHLYIQCFEVAYLINIHTSEIIQEYSLLFDQTDHHPAHDLTVFTSKKFQHALFTEEEPLTIYGIIEVHKKKVYGDGRVSAELTQFEHMKSDLKTSSLFKSTQCKMLSKTKLEYNGTIGYNKSLTQIVLPGEQVFYVFQIPSLQEKSPFLVQSCTLQPIRNVQNCQVNKNSFLFNKIWVTYNDDNYETFTLSPDDLTRKYATSDIDLDDYSLGDTFIEQKHEDLEQCVITIGKNHGKNSVTSSRFCMNASRVEEVSSEVNQINYINELSEFVCIYPFIIFCKGNSELFFQSIHNPKKLIKLDLTEQFLCFAEINYSIDHKPDHIAMGMSDGTSHFKKYETIAFLTQKDDKIFMNFLEYKLPFGGEEVCRDSKNHFHMHSEEDKNESYLESNGKGDNTTQIQMEESNQYFFYRSNSFISKPSLSYGNLVKAVFSKVKHKECKDHDYILIMQYRNAILIRSFYNLYHQNIDKYIYKFPLIYMPSGKKNKPDLSFFVSRDGYSTKIERICFSGKEMKDSPVQTVYELKTQQIFVFNYHSGHFYIMDDTLNLKKLQFDKRNQKFKVVKVFEFAVEYRDLLSAVSNEFNDVQVTDSGVYKGVLFIPFYDSSIYNKDYSLIKVEPVLNIKRLEDLFEGPKKLLGTDYILYIARENKEVNVKSKSKDSDSEQNQSEEDNNSDEIEEEDEPSVEPSEASNVFDDTHNIPPKSSGKPETDKIAVGLSHMNANRYDTNKDSQNDSPEPKKTGDRQGPKETNDFASKSAKTVGLHKKNALSADDNQPGLKFTFTMRGKKESNNNIQREVNQEDDMSPISSLFDKNGRAFAKTQGQSKQATSLIRQMTINNSEKRPVFEEEIKIDFATEQVYAWIVPYLDSNVIYLTHNRKENNNPLYQITFSSFLNTNDQILCQINQVFYLFSKNGSFMYEILVTKNKVSDQFYFLKYELELQHVSTNHRYFLFYSYKNNNYEVFRLITSSGVMAKTQRANRAKRRVTRMTAAQTLLGQSRKAKQFDLLTYSFQYVKTVKEQSNIYNFEDYLQQRTVTNEGLVVQAVTQKIVNLDGLAVDKEPSPRRKYMDSEQFAKEKNKTRMMNLKTKKTLRKLKSQNDFKRIFGGFAEFDIKTEKIMNIFELYLDDELISDYNNKFSLIQAHVYQTEDSLAEYYAFGYQLLGEQLLIRRGNKLEYMRILNLKEEDKQETPSHKQEQSTPPLLGSKSFATYKPIQKATMLNLSLDKGVEILRLMETVRDDLLQVIASDERFIFVITWNISSNMEHAMIQIENKFNFQPAHIVCKGVSEKLNYIPIENGLYDLTYSLPFMIFKNLKIGANKSPTMQINERKLARFNNKYLDFFDNNKIYMSYSYLDLCYMKALKNKNEDKIEQPQILIQHLNFRVRGITIFHEFSCNYHFLQHVYYEVIKADEQNQSGTINDHDDDENRMTSKRLIFLNLLYPNFYNNNAFDIVMSNKSPKSMEIMLQMLSELPLFSISKWIMPHFQELLALELKSFDDFMSSCQFQQPKMREVQTIKWNYREDELFVDYHTSYLGNAFLNMIQGRRDKDIDGPAEQQTLTMKSQDVLHTADFTQFELIEGKGDKNNLMIKDEESKKRKGKLSLLEPEKKKLFDEKSTQFKRVELNAVEFDWVFKGDMAIQFIGHLAKTDNDTLFSNPTIRVIILFLWKNFFYQIRNKVFIPFIIYFITYIALTSLITQKSMTAWLILQGNEDGYPTDGITKKVQQNWRVTELVFVVICLIQWTYFAGIEIYQVYYYRVNYLKQFWNYIDLASLAVNMTFFVFNLCGLDAKKGRVLSSISVFLFYIKAFYFFRLFSGTAAFMRMIIQICLDMRVFTLIWFFAVIAFANTIYILSHTMPYDQMYAFIEESYLQAFIYYFQLGLGSFVTDYNNFQYPSIWWILFLLQSLLIQIVFFNLLIAIMADTFDRVQSSKLQQKLREICQLISEYEYCVNRDIMFKNSKYIIVAAVEKAETTNSTDWGGKISALKLAFQHSVVDIKREQKLMSETIKDEILANNKIVDQKFADLQQFVLKQSSQVAGVVKKIDQMVEKIAVIHKNQLKSIENQQELIQNLDTEGGDKARKDGSFFQKFKKL